MKIPSFTNKAIESIKDDMVFNDIRGINPLKKLNTSKAIEHPLE